MPPNHLIDCEDPLCRAEERCSFLPDREYRRVTCWRCLQDLVRRLLAKEDVRRELDLVEARTE